MTYHPNRVTGRWRSAWKSVTKDEITLLGDVIRGIMATGESQSQICDDAEITEYQLKSILAGRRLRDHWPGLRLLRYAAQWRGKPLSSDLLEKHQRLRAVSGASPIADHDADYFFRHLERLDVISKTDCQKICSEISGHYYSHRLSRTPNRIIRSHYHIQPYNPNNRLPHFVNKLKYGNDPASPDHVERTAQGQIFPLGDTYILIGFVSLGYETEGKLEYDGLQVNVFSAEQFRLKRKVIEGIFLSYVYTGRYEMGVMRLVRGGLEFDRDQVSEFSFEEIKKMCPEVDLSELLIDVKGHSEITKGLDGRVIEVLLKSCLSFAISKEHIIPFG